MTYVWPEPTSSAAGIRDQNLVSFLSSEGVKIFVSSPSRSNPHRERLEALGVSTFQFEANDSRFDSFIRELAPDGVIFDRFVTEEQFGWRVQAHSPQSLRILDTQDLHFLRKTRQKMIQAGKSVREAKYPVFDFSDPDLLREVASIYRSDLTWLLSRFEKEILTEGFQIPSHKLALSKFAYPQPSALPLFEDRRDFVMIGNFRHAPNQDSVFWMKEEIWPKIRKRLPEARLHIFGAYPNRQVSELHNESEGFWIQGWTSDSIQTLKSYRVNLAPLRFGAGIKGKITDGWSAGTPVVSTSIGAEGMHESLTWGGAIADDSEEFADKACRLHEDRESWLFTQENGKIIMESIYSEKAFAASIRNDWIQAEQNHNEKNLIQEMLWSQQFRATEYFSRWIEAKNSKAGESL